MYVINVGVNFMGDEESYVSGILMVRVCFFLILLLLLFIIFIEEKSCVSGNVGYIDITIVIFIIY